MESLTKNTIALSPLAVLILGLGAPVIGSMVSDRIKTGESTAGDSVQIQSLREELKYHIEHDSVHRAEFEDLKRLDQTRVSEDTFRQFADSVKTDMRDIKQLITESFQQGREREQRSHSK